MDSRPNLQTMLENLLGSRNVYFQPPASVVMKYPAIRYSRDDIQNKHANDGVYKQNIAYELVVIDHDPDSEIVSKVSKLPMCSWVTNYSKDGLHHDVFKLYY